jgi:hypothetical protein
VAVGGAGQSVCQFAPIVAAVSWHEPFVWFDGLQYRAIALAFVHAPVPPHAPVADGIAMICAAALLSWKPPPSM